jgi:uncharacterized membrane-anchored protein YjiN (DUF445 family)
VTAPERASATAAGSVGWTVNGAEADRRRQLRAMKARASGLLVIATIVFVVARILENDHSWLGYVRATAEAAMVGGIADWFAVTALFRHPLGLPIPHTAIIPTRKDQLGRNLGEFVEENFLDAKVVSEKLRGAHIAQRAAAWLDVAEHRATAGRHLGAAIAGAVDVLRDDEIQQAIEQAVLERIRRVPLSPLAGRTLETMTANGRHHELVDAATKGAIRFLDEHREDLRARFGNESPWWVPEPIDKRIFEKLFSGMHAFLQEVADTPDHDLRRYFDERLAALAIELQHDDALRARGEQLKAELLDHSAVRSWTGSLWADLKGTLLTQSADPDSELRRRIDSGLESLAHTLAADPELQAKVDGWIEGVVRYVIESYRHEAADLIATTVAKWDGAEASDRMELAVGRDLQYIRINGTLVGGLAGLAIHTVGQLL